jgi:proteasome alpha subunit
MSQMPFYVSPEQLMKDRADFARKGIARGRSVIVVSYDEGILFVAENHSRTLHKVSEIYDRIGFAAVGKYNEFENLRVAGVRYADLRGYSYDRSDVTARGTGQRLRPDARHRLHPGVQAVRGGDRGRRGGVDADADQLYRLMYDGSVADERAFVAMGGAAELIEEGLKELTGEGHPRAGRGLAPGRRPAGPRPGRGSPRELTGPRPIGSGRPGPQPAPTDLPPPRWLTA